MKTKKLLLSFIVFAFTVFFIKKYVFGEFSLFQDGITFFAVYVIIYFLFFRRSGSAKDK